MNKLVFKPRKCTVHNITSAVNPIRCSALFQKYTSQHVISNTTKEYISIGFNAMNIYYSNFDKHKFTYFHWAQCNEPTTLTLGNLR